MKRWWRLPIFWVILSTIFFLSFYILVVVFRHLNYFSAHFDLGNMDQVMWQSLHGHWFQMVDSGSGERISRLNYHADVLLLIYLPFYALIQHPLTMAILQVIAVGSAALPLFWFAKKQLPGWVAAIMAISYLAYPPLLWNVIFDVHAVTLVVPLVIWAVWAVDARRWWIYGMMILLLPFAKEQVGITVALIGFLVAWKIRPRWVGILTAMYGLAITALMLFVIIPSVRQSADHFFLKQYSEYGSTTSEVVIGMLKHPVQVVKTIFNAEGRSYLYHLVGPLGGFSVVAIPYVFAVAPEFAINTLSAYGGMRTIVFQYTSVITPILILAAVLGMARWWRWTTKKPLLRKAGVAWYVLAALFFVWHDAPVPLGRHREVMNVFVPSPYRSDIAKIKRTILLTDAVAVTNTLGPQFTRRDNVWGFPYALDRANVIVAMFDDLDISAQTAELRLKMEEIKKDPQWSVILEHNGLTYLRKK